MLTARSIFLTADALFRFFSSFIMNYHVHPPFLESLCTLFSSSSQILCFSAGSPLLTPPSRFFFVILPQHLFLQRLSGISSLIPVVRTFISSPLFIAIAILLSSPSKRLTRDSLPNLEAPNSFSCTYNRIASESPSSILKAYSPSTPVTD